MSKKISLASTCVHHPEWTFDNPPNQLPLVPASAFAFETIEQGIDIFDGRQKGHIYSRFGNPTTDAVAAKIARLEGFDLDSPPRGLLTSSGMSAIATLVMALLQPGDKLLTQADLYGGSVALFRDVLSPLKIEMLVADLRDRDSVEQLLAEQGSIRMIYCETPSNPVLRCIDLDQLADWGRRYHCLTVADNTFATPILQRPLNHGIDYVIHSTTKYLNGHGNGIAGAIIGRDEEAMDGRITSTLRLLGTNASPWEAWTLHNGLKTLSLRMERHDENAQAVAEFLQSHPAVGRVNYLGFKDHPDYALAQRQMSAPGGMISFDLKGGLEAGKRFMNRLRFCTLAPTLGDTDTLILHPATMSHRALDRDVRLAHGITDGLVRISVGIEAVEDIIADLEQAMEG